LLSRPEIRIESNAWPLVLSFPTEDVHLGGIRRALGDWLDEQGACGATRSAVVLATHEAVANAVEHSRTGHSVIIRGRADHGKVTIEVSDDGDWQQATFEDQERGRGLMMIAALVDEFEFVFNKPGTTIRMVRAARPH
jgi:anti-sigma regulatory factor (Ser/Thr protein kinase)